MSRREKRDKNAYGYIDEWQKVNYHTIGVPAPKECPCCKRSSRILTVGPGQFRVMCDFTECGVMTPVIHCSNNEAIAGLPWSKKVKWACAKAVAIWNRRGIVSDE